MTHSVYTPFLRRFTDERARDLAELKALHDRVTTAHEASIWSKGDAVERVSGYIASQVQGVAELPMFLPLARAFDTCQTELLKLEAVIFRTSRVDFSKPISINQSVDLNHFLHAREWFLANDDRVSSQLVLAIGNVSAGVIQSLPPIAESAFTVPLICAVANPNDVVDRVVGTICKEELAQAGLFTTLQQRILENMARYSGIRPGSTSSKPLIPAIDADLSPTELVETYLAGTPLADLLLTHVPFALPDEQRYSGHWIVAPAGRGKTTLLHSMFLGDLERDASIIIIDSKGDLIGPIKELRAIKDRLVLVEPNPDCAFALNPFDVPKADVLQAVNLIEYVMAGILDAKFTALQSTLFRNVVPAIIEGLPSSTIETFKAVMQTGFPHAALERLNPHARQFLDNRETGFYSKTYESTRKEVVWRLDYLMTNPVMRAMFSAPRTKLDLSHEMDAGKIIIIDNSKAMLTDDGAEFMGRFFIALIVRAAQQRAGRRQQDKKPCYVYIDECHTVISKDARVPTILDECRSQKIALILAHQRTAQLTAAVLDAVANSAIRMANSDDEAKFLSDKLRMTVEDIRSMPRGTFGTFVRDLTPQGVALKVPFMDLARLPQMTSNEQSDTREKMRRLFAVDHVGQTTSKSAATEQAKPSVSGATANVTQPSPTMERQSKGPDVNSPEAGSTW